MGVHDWSRVDDGIFHDFHHAWIEEIKRELNGGLLPEWLYALAEQQVSEFGPDVLALQAPGSKDEMKSSERDDSSDSGSDTGLMVAPPRVAMTLQGAEDFYTPGNKSSQQRLEAFVRKACSLLRQGIHLLVLDLHLPTRRAPDGIHGAIWNIIGSSSDEDYHQPADKPLTLDAYQSRLDAGVTAYVEPVAIGDLLREMPLYVTAEGYVSVPLLETYDRAFAALPRRWASVLEQ